MNEEALNMSLRKFLKVVGVTSLTIGEVGLNHKVEGTIELE
jgi:hypothetical protein